VQMMRKMRKDPSNMEGSYHWALREWSRARVNQPPTLVPLPSWVRLLSDQIKPIKSCCIWTQNLPWFSLIMGYL
jgi:hypothetical protein